MAIITISRGTMSGGKKLAELLCEKLGYKCISREIIMSAAEKYGVPEYKLFAAIQKGPSLFQRLTDERERYLTYIQATLCDLVKDDNVVYHGHAGHFILQGISHVLRIRIVADMNYRIKSAMEQQNLLEKEAEKHIREVDKQRTKWTKFLYGVDWRSPELCDMVFNLQNIDLEFVCSMIERALSLPQFKTTPESMKKMNNLLLECQVKAMLAGISTVQLGQLEIEGEDSNITLKGKVKSKELSEIIEETTAKVDGVDKVVNNLEINYRYQGIDT